MPSDFAHDKDPSLVYFRHTQAATRLPEGTYEGIAVGAPYVLGTNGMGRKWQTVKISGGAFDGQIVSIWSNDQESTHAENPTT